MNYSLSYSPADNTNKHNYEEGYALGFNEGYTLQIIKGIRSLHKYNYTIETISDGFKESVFMVKLICKLHDENPALTDKDIYQKLLDYTE